MNLIESFATFLETTTGATLGQDLFIGNAPSSNKVPDSIWWIVASGGAKDSSLQTGEALKRYQIDIFYRNIDYKVVYDSLHDLEETLNCDGCTQLEGYETVDIEANVFPIDNDLDSEVRKVGLLQANILTYKDCD